MDFRHPHGFDGLLVDPVIPAKWKGFTVTRKFRGNTYVIEIKNPKGLQRGVKKLLVDGKEISRKCAAGAAAASQTDLSRGVLEG